MKSFASSDTRRSSVEGPDREGAVPRTLITQSHALGEAEYWLPDVYSPTKLHIPWSYKLVDDWRLVSQEPGLYQLVGFSRVAFDVAHGKALFAVSDTSGGGGGGGAVYAYKKNGAWVFESSGCNWVY
jgi:hypothetical protein